ncbi:MAG: hypothetical protein LVS60_01200 [Nodosilinea sp. LVE1205-7]|jgi:hypothetical protein
MANSNLSPNLSPEVVSILKLLREYSFDIDHYAAEELISQWIQEFSYRWVGNAITEALYQGRYKIISVDHILQLWQRRGQPIRHFSREFESIILGQTPLAPTMSPEVNDAIAVHQPEPLTSLEGSIPPQAPVPDFRPILEGFSSVWVSSVDAIPPFVPRWQSSDLHQRLRSVVQADLER